MARDWPLSGRDEELRYVAAAMRWPATGGSGVVLSGAAGVGKTRLAREALELARERGATVRWAYGTASARTMPLGAFAGLLGELAAEPALLLRHAADALTGGQARVVLGVDDAHLLDEVSAMLVHHLVVRRVATVVATLRSGEPVPGAVRALWKDGHVPRLEIRPLSEPETAALLEAALEGPVESAAVHCLWSLTGGNPMLLRHLADGELAAGRLRHVEGLWCWRGQAQLSVELAELVRERMGELARPVRDVLDLLALGEPLGHAALARLTGPDAIEDAESAGLVRLDTDGRRLPVRLAHPLYGEVRRAELGVARARRLRGRIATSIAGTGGRRSGDTVRRAVLTLDSDLTPDPVLFESAAREALRLLDLGLCERLARAAVDAGAGREAKLALGYALTWLSKGPEAEQVFGELHASAGAGPERAHLALVRTGNLFWTMRDEAAADAVLSAALAETTDASARAALTAMRVALDASLARARTALGSGLRLLDSPLLGGQVRALAAVGVMAAAAVLGRVDDVRRAAPVAYEAARTSDAGVLRFGISDSHILALRLSGNVREIEPIARERRADSVDVPGPPQLMGLVLLGQAALAAGRVRTAVRWLREARAGLRAVATHEFRFRCRLHLTQALALAGETEAARRLLAELDAERHPAYRFHEPDVVLAGAWVCAAEGATREAIAAARSAADCARDADAPAYEVLALNIGVCFGDRDAGGRLGELVSRVQGPRAPTALAHAQALAEQDGAALLSVAGRYEAMGDRLAAADAAAQAATACARRGLRGSAAVAAARAHHLAEACEGARTPALAAAASPLPLTAREREVVTLAAQGLSNRDIARRLVLSVRTVEGHLYRVGTKLGVGDRAELAALLRQAHIE
ncbi:LuxR C-terminal-related transcriptional regulator [Prauserella muralis]|nr:LuxR family transcriptional regulator [Prauserella muralis]TWE27693.1 AAA ATPase-like protein [Prauserella muralis]